MSGNGHLSPEAVWRVRDVIAMRIYAPAQVADMCGVSLGAVYYQRDAMGMGPKRRAEERPCDAATPHNAIYNYRLCFCSGCYKPAKDGKFCDDHSAPAMAQRVTAGMSEATRRKLMGAR